MGGWRIKMPNGPSTDSLVIRHTPSTVPGGARPGWGLPYQRLPQGRLTSESMLEQEIQTGKQQIQDKYALQWKTVQQSRQSVGATKTAQMLRQIDMNAKQEMQAFNQRAQTQLTQLRNIDRLAEQGVIRNPDEIKARMTFGTDVARSMYPKPEKEKPPMQQFSELDIYSHRISDELEWFKEDKPSKPLGILAGISPLTAAISTYRSRRKPKRKVRIWDPATEDYTIEATPEKIAEYDMWLREQKDVAKLKRELTGRLGTGRRIVQPGTRGGTFSDKIAESVRPRQAPTPTKQKTIRQRNRNTGQERISYDGGRTWQIVSG